MAHVNLHLAAGLVVGAVAGAVPLGRAWLAGRPVSGPILRIALASFALAAWAAMPQVLTTLGASGRVHAAWWADVFVGHRTIDRRIDGGLLIGEVVIAAYLCGLYVVVLVALWRARRDRGGSPPPG
jgi:hypothetical protein